MHSKKCPHTILEVSWLDHLTNVLRRLKLEQLSHIVRTRRLTSAGNILGYVYQRKANKHCHKLGNRGWQTGSRKATEDIQRGPWSNEWTYLESMMTTHDGENLLPNVPAGMGATKSKCKVWDTYLWHSSTVGLVCMIKCTATCSHYCSFIDSHRITVITIVVKVSLPVLPQPVISLYSRRLKANFSSHSLRLKHWYRPKYHRIDRFWQSSDYKLTLMARSPEPLPYTSCCLLAGHCSPGNI